MCIRDRPPPARTPARVHHHQIHRPHQDGEQYLGIEEIDAPERGLRDYGTCNQPERHEGKPEKQRTIADVVNYFECRQARKDSRRFLGLQCAFLDQIKKTGAKTYTQGRITGKDEGDVRDQPALAHPGRHLENWLLTGSGHQSQKKHQGEHDDARGGGFIGQVHEHESHHDQEGQHRFRIVHRSQRDLPRELDGFGQGDQMEDHPEIGRVQGDFTQQVAAAGKSHQCIKQANRVAAERNSQPKDGHR